MRLSQRLASAREDAGLTQAAVARRLKVTRNAISLWENGKSNPKAENLEQLATIYNVTYEWLATGRGARMMATAGAANRVPANSNGIVTVGELEANHEGPPRTGAYTFPAAGFREIYGTSPDRARIAEVAGDNMEPTLHQGQRVMVDVGDRLPSPPGIFVLWNGASIVFNRIEYISQSEPPRVRISADNPSYKAREAFAADADLRGRVIGAWTRL